MHKTLLLVLLLMPLLAKAQFMVIDSSDKEPLPGVYVFAANGALIDMSNAKGEVTKAHGTVTLSMLSYEPLTIDVSKAGKVVEMKSQPLQLSEVVVQKTEYTKISGTFRDVVVCSDKVVMYREGLMDFYLNNRSGDIKRRIRACRQVEHPDLRNWSKNDSLHMDICPTFDLGSIRRVKTSGESEQKGDTTMVWAMHGNETVKDGIMEFEKNGRHRVIIDALKFSNSTSISFLGLHKNYTKAINDWTYKGKSSSRDSLIAYRLLVSSEYQFSKKSPLLNIEMTKDFVVNDVSYLTKEKAKEEMKFKDTESENFTLTDCLPPLPSALTDQIPSMKRTKRRDY